MARKASREGTWSSGIGVGSATARKASTEGRSSYAGLVQVQANTEKLLGALQAMRESRDAKALKQLEEQALALLLQADADRDRDRELGVLLALRVAGPNVLEAAVLARAHRVL